MKFVFLCLKLFIICIVGFMVWTGCMLMWISRKYSRDELLSHAEEWGKIFKEWIKTDLKNIVEDEE